MPMYMRNELMFPPYAIPMLRDLRGPEWRQLVEHVMALPEDHPDSLAFSLMMIRLDGCMTCETDGYRAMRGCILCATQTVRRFKGPDKDLVKAYRAARKEVVTFMRKQEREKLAAQKLAAPRAARVARTTRAPRKTVKAVKTVKPVKSVKANVAA
jgi:hypothetical protein